MAELIKKSFAKLVSVEPMSGNTSNEVWAWRKKYEGFYGIMNLYQSQRKQPGKYFIVIYDVDLQYFKTGTGELTMDDNHITLITKNSKYTFEKLEKDCE